MQQNDKIIRAYLSYYMRKCNYLNKLLICVGCPDYIILPCSARYQYGTVPLNPLVYINYFICCEMYNSMKYTKAFKDNQMYPAY